MTTPHERATAVVQARQLLLQLAEGKWSNKVPVEVQQEALALLRHYPDAGLMELAAELSPLWFEAPRAKTKLTPSSKD